MHRGIHVLTVCMYRANIIIEGGGVPFAEDAWRNMIVGSPVGPHKNVAITKVGRMFRCTVIPLSSTVSKAGMLTSFRYQMLIRLCSAWVAPQRAEPRRARRKHEGKGVHGHQWLAGRSWYHPSRGQGAGNGMADGIINAMMVHLTCCHNWCKRPSTWDD